MGQDVIVNFDMEHLAHHLLKYSFQLALKLNMVEIKDIEVEKEAPTAAVSS